MKASIVIVFITLLTLVQADGQDDAKESSDTQTRFRINKDRKGGEQLALPVKSKLESKPKKVNWGGFFADFRKLWKPVKVLSDSTPPMTKREEENLYKDPASGKPLGFVLFAIRF